MKEKIIFLFFFLIHLQGLSAQESWQLAFTDLYYEINDAVNTGDGLAVVGSTESCRSPLIRYFSADGNLEWEASTPVSSYGQYNAVLLTADSNILAIGRTRIADDVLGEDGLILDLFDRDGNLLANNKLFDFNPPYDFELPAITLASGNYLIANGYYLVEVNPALELVNKIEGSFAVIQQLEALTDSSFAINNSEIFEVYLNDGTFLGSPEELTVIDYVFKAGDRVMITDDNNIYHYDPLTGQANFVTAGLLHWVSDHLLIDDQLLLYGVDPFNPIGNEGSLFDPLNNQVSQAFVWNYENRSLEILVPLTSDSEDGYYAVGQNLWEGEEADIHSREIYGAYVQRAADESLVLDDDYDAALLDFQANLNMNSIQVVEEPGGAFTYFVELEGTAIIQNRGAATLDSVILFSQNTLGFNCIDERFIKHFKDLGLGPFQTAILPFTNEISFTSLIGDISELDIEACYYLAVPNDKLDADLSNNSNCSLIVDVETEPTADEQVLVYPNPAQSSVQIETQALGIESLTLLNGLGQQLWEVDVEGQSSYQLLRSANWPAGQYHLKIRTEKGLIQRKLIFF